MGFGVIAGVLLLFLFHFESLSIGPIKVSHVWKGLLLALLVFFVFSRSKIYVSVYKPLLILAILNLISMELIVNPFNAVLTFGTTLIIPLIGIFTLRKDSIWCKKALYFISSFVILSFIPYEVGMLSSITEGYDIERSYGFALHGLIGPFQTVHSASTALAGSLIVLTYFWFEGAYNRIWLSSLFVLGLYFLFSTYVRTGMAMYAVGLLPMLWHFGSRNGRSFVRMALFVIGVVPFLIVWVLSNEALMARILGERSYSNEFSSFETMGSGRGAMILYSFEIFAEANILEQAIGMGETEQKKRMGLKLGRELVPHNGFLYIILTQGLVGLFLFIWFLLKVKKMINRESAGESRSFLVSLLSAYLVMTFFQNYHLLYMFLILILGCSYATGRNLYDARFQKKPSIVNIKPGVVTNH